MRTTHKIVTGDSRDMAELGDGSVHLVVTSPPYWQLKDYGYPGQIGFDDTYQDYVNNLSLVWAECIRVLHPGCRMAVNVGDQFARRAQYGRYKVIPIRTEIIKFCEAAGLDYMGAVIWQKKTTMNTSGGASVMGSFPYPRNGIVEIDYEFVLLFKKLGEPPAVSKEIKEQARLSKEEWKEYFSGHWHFGGTRQDGHIAMFPEELPKRLIRMFTFPGEVVLDPFLGSGTTTLAARKLGRSSVGYEADGGLLGFIKDKVGMDDNRLFQDAEFEIVRQVSRDMDWRKKIETLPYRFVDPHSFDKKANPRQKSFGSKIAMGDTGGKDGLLKVKAVLSSEVVELDDGRTVRLLGVKSLRKTSKDAVEFLTLKAKGRQVYVKTDDAVGGDGAQAVYLYLKNRTFINAHLIKKGLAEVDTVSDYRHKARFIAYADAARG